MCRARAMSVDSRLLFLSRCTYLVRESVPQRDGREQHFDADEKVLIAGGHRTGGRGRTTRIDDRRNDLRLFQNGQSHA